MTQSRKTRRGYNLKRVQDRARSAADDQDHNVKKPNAVVFVVRFVFNGNYLEHYDPNAHAPGAPYPTGYASMTTDIKRAITFSSQLDAMRFISQQSSTSPLRPDGKLNRPLLHFVLLIEPVSPLTGAAK